MAQKRNRWLVNTILIVAVASFLGVSIYPLIDGIRNSASTQAVTSPSPTQSVDNAIANRRLELENQAKGYESVLQAEPDNQVALKQLVRIRAQMNDAKGAIAPLERLVKLNPNQTDYSILLAQVKQEAGDSEGSAQIYRSLLETQPGNLNALQGFVYLLLKEKQPEKAIGLLQDTIKSAPQKNEIQPNSVDVAAVQLMLGGVYTNQKRYDEAIAVFDEAAKVNKQDYRPVMGKALVLKEQGKTEEAKALFETAESLAPADKKDEIKLAAQQPAQSTATPANTPTAAPSVAPSPQK